MVAVITEPEKAVETGPVLNPSSGTELNDGTSSGDIFWEGGDDPTNPYNWSLWFKWGHVVLVFSLTFVVSLASSMLAPTIPQVTKSLRSDTATLDSFVLSVYVIGFALGPLVVAPLSELYGRLPVYHISNGLCIGFSVGCALSTNIGMFITFRLLTGCVGVVPLALGACTIGDIMRSEAIGTPMAVWGLASLIAPLLAPVAGGYLSEAAGWRWVFWTIIIATGLSSAIALFLFKETYGPAILEKKARRLRKETGNQRLQSRLASKEPALETIRSAFLRPLRLLSTSPIVILLSIDVAIIYGYQYLTFSTLSFIYQEQYHFSQGQSGLIFIGTGIGTILAVLILGPLLDKLESRNKRSGGQPQPENCLWPQIPAAFLVPAGLFLYGWTLQANAQPAVPLVGLGIFGFGMMAIFMPVQMYLVQAFGTHSASALAASNTLRNIVGAVLPLAGQDLYAALGNGWGNSLLAFVAIALIPIPFVLIRFGARWRAKDKNIPLAPEGPTPVVQG